MDTKLYNEIMDEYRHLVECQDPGGDINRFKINVAKIVLDVLEIYLEKTK